MDNRTNWLTEEMFEKMMQDAIRPQAAPMAQLPDLRSLLQKAPQRTVRTQFNPQKPNRGTNVSIQQEG